MAALGIQGSRNIHLVVDETVWHPMYEVISGLRDDMGYIGGYINRSESEDYTWLEQGAEELNPKWLSKLSVHYIMTRADTNRHMYMLDMLPRAPKKPAAASSQSALTKLYYIQAFLTVVLGILTVENVSW